MDSIPDEPLRRCRLHAHPCMLGVLGAGSRTLWPNIFEYNPGQSSALARCISCMTIMWYLQLDRPWPQLLSECQIGDRVRNLSEPTAIATDKVLHLFWLHLFCCLLTVGSSESPRKGFGTWTSTGHHGCQFSHNKKNACGESS